MTAQEYISLRTQRKHGRHLAFALGVAFAFVPAVLHGSADAVDRHQFGAVVWFLVAFGLLTGAFPRPRLSRELRLLLGGFTLWTGLMMLSLAWTDGVGRTVEELARLTGYAGLVVLVSLAIPRGEWRSAAAGLLAGAVGVCAVALALRLSPAELGGERVVDGRLSAPLGYWNALASWSAATFAMALAWSAESMRVWERALTLAATPVAGACLYLTYSRGGLLAAGVGVAVVLLLSRRRRRALVHIAVALVCTGGTVFVLRTQEEIATGTGTGGAGLVVLALLASMVVGSLAALRLRRISRGSDRPAIASSSRYTTGLVAAILAVAAALPALYSFTGGEEPVLQSAAGDPSSRLLTVEGNRAAYWRTSLDAFWSSPVSGLGPGTFEFFWSKEGGRVEQVRDAHSLYLEQLAELGIFGLVAAITVAAGALRGALVPYGRGSADPAAVALPSVVVVFVVHAGLDALWEWTALGVLALAAASIGAAAGLEVEYRRRRRSRVERRSDRRLAIVVGVIAVVGVAIQLPGLVSGARIEESREATRRGFDVLAEKLATDAIEAAPWAALPYVNRAAARGKAGDTRGAIEDAGKAVDREPLNFRSWVLLAELYEDGCEREEAVQAFATAVELAPTSTLLTSAYGQDLRERISSLSSKRPCLPAGAGQPRPPQSGGP